jgi:hypothetical protein
MPRAKTARNGSSQTPTSAAAVQTAPTPPSAPTLAAKSNGNTVDLQSEIRQRAYELYEQRGRTPGYESEDWVVAEREVIARHSARA